LLLLKILEIEDRIEQYISLMLEVEMNLPDTAFKYTRLKDIIGFIEGKKSTEIHHNPMARLEEEKIKADKMVDINDDDYIFRNDGDTWTVKFNNVIKTVKHTKGMGYIAYLIKNQGQEIYTMRMLQDIASIKSNINKTMSDVSDSRIDSEEGLHLEGEDKIDVIDQKTIDAVQDEISKIEKELDAPETDSNTIHKNQLVNRLDKLKDYLSKATFNGKIRTASDANEKSRQSITKAIKTAKLNIRKHHKKLFTHLDKYISTGSSNSYSPKSYVDWNLF
jgi:hypothetical protein